MVRAPDLNTKNFVEIVIHITSTLRLRSVTLCVEGDAFMLKPFWLLQENFTTSGDAVSSAVSLIAMK